MEETPNTSFTYVAYDNQWPFFERLEYDKYW